MVLANEKKSLSDNKNMAHEEGTRIALQLVKDLHKLGELCDAGIREADQVLAEMKVFLARIREDGTIIPK